MTSHIRNGLEKAKASGFAPADMLIDKFNGGDTEVSLAVPSLVPSNPKSVHYTKKILQEKLAYFLQVSIYFLISQRKKQLKF